MVVDTSKIDVTYKIYQYGQDDIDIYPTGIRPGGPEKDKDN